MAEPVKGQLVWQGDGDKRIRKVTFPTKKGTSQPTHFDADQLAVSLKNCKEDKVDVDLEVVAGKPVRIRPVGEPFTAPPQQEPVRSSHQQRGTNYSGHLKMGSHGQTQHQIVPIRGVFHNPYNFVPAPQRNGINGELGDHKPVGHHVFHPDHYTGVIRVKMTVKTPLLLPDAANAKDVDNDHKSFPVRVDTAGKPYIAPTSIKGMLRTAYEAITNSRMGVLGNHTDRLAFRMPTNDGLRLVPARVFNGKIELLPGTSKIGNDGRPVGPMYGAWLPRYQRTPLCYPDGTLPQHGDNVTCWLVLKEHHNPRFQFWGVRKIFHQGQVIGRPDNDCQQVDGYVCITNQNIKNKHDERVFFTIQSIKSVHDLTEELVKQWVELITNYQNKHKDDLSERKRRNQQFDQYLGSNPGKTAWSRHVYEKDAEKLSEGTLCYALLDANLRIAQLFPVMISRQLFESSPLSLLPESLRPASSLQQLSPADRVFGWVNPHGKGACKGNVRIGLVKCESSDSVENFGNPGMPLAILGQPKPEQAAFYVAASENGDAQSNGLGKKDAGYKPAKGLRGRKVYPHHKGLPLNHWNGAIEDRTQQDNDGHFQEYRRPKLAGQEQRDKQNRSIQGWIKPDTKFTFDIHVTNLSKVELGALLWLLNLPEECFHRFGGGKPLGFGSVRLEITFSSLHDGSGWKKIYSNLSGVSPSQVDSSKLIGEFQKSVITAYGQGASFENVSFIAAWLKMATGHSDNLPTHYPRSRQQGQEGLVPPNPNGLAFKWFVANDRTGKDSGPKVSLPNLKSDHGLPMLG